MGFRTNRFNSYSPSATSELAVLFQPAGAPSRKRLVVYCHAAGADHTASYDHTYYAKVLEALANAGYAVIVADLAGQNAWSTDTHMARITDAIAWVAANTVVATDKVYMTGVSMGGAAACLWSSLNPSKVASLQSFFGAIDLEYVHDNIAGANTIIDSAYGGNAMYNAQKVAHNASKQAGPILAAGIPTRVYYSTSDVYTPTATATAFAAACGASTVNLGAVAHGVAMSNVDPAGVVSFIGANS